MTTISPIFPTTLQESLTDDTCGMRYWYSYLERGAGITPKKDLLPTAILDATQADLREIAMLPDLSVVVLQELTQDILSKVTPEQRNDTRAMELLYRRLGWMNAFALFIEPGIRRLYLTIPMDEEITLDRAPLSVKVRPGRVLKHRQSQEIEVREYLPTANSNARWRDGWEWHIRPHLNLLTTREKLMRKVDFARIGGLHLGITSAIENAKLRHPYVYAYYNKLTKEWTHQYQTVSLDWEERPVWEYPGTLTEWVRRCGMTVAETQFPLSPRIPLNGPIVDAWVNRRTFRERQVRPIREHAKNNHLLRILHFGHNTQACTPLHEAQCPFKDLCWSEPFMADALHQTQYVAKPLSPGRRVWLPPYKPTLSEQLETAIKEGKLVEVLADNTQLLPRDQMTLPSEPDLTLPIIDLTPIKTVPTEHQLSIN